MSAVKPRPMPPFPMPGRVQNRHYCRLRRTRLKYRSERKASWHALYVAGLKFLLKLDPMCRRCRERLATQGHHPFWQSGALILLFWPLCSFCHSAIHASPNKAREEGCLL
jgi:hypothetical protein